MGNCFEGLHAFFATSNIHQEHSQVQAWKWLWNLWHRRKVCSWLILSIRHYDIIDHVWLFSQIITTILFKCRFEPSKFDAIFSKYGITQPNALTSEELSNMLRANRNLTDFNGWLVSLLFFYHLLPGEYYILLKGLRVKD